MIPVPKVGLTYWHTDTPEFRYVITEVNATDVHFYGGSYTDGKYMRSGTDRRSAWEVWAAEKSIATTTEPFPFPVDSAALGRVNLDLEANT